MKLLKNLVSLGRGLLSGATVIGGTARIIIKSDGKLTKKSMLEGTRQPFGARLAGYCDDIWELPGGVLERVGEELYFVSVG